MWAGCAQIQRHMISAVEVAEEWLTDARAMAHLTQRGEQLDWLAIQRRALENGENLPPSALRALLREESHTTVAKKASDAAPRSPSHSSTSTDSSLAARCDVLAKANISLSNIPDCVLLCILGFLDAPTLSSMACASSEFAALVSSNDGLWCSLVQRRFRGVSWALPAEALTPTAGCTWRALYIVLSTPGPDCWRTLAVAPHASDDSCWIVIGDGIYDVTDFMHRHPGMAASLRLFGGTDATDAFAEVPHSPLAHHYMRSLQVPGLYLPPECPPPLLAGSSSCAPLTSELQTIVRKRIERLRNFVANFPRTVHETVVSTAPSLPWDTQPWDSLPSVTGHLPSLPSVAEHLPSLPNVTGRLPSLRRPSWEGVGAPSFETLTTTAAACVAGVAAVSERFGPMRPSAWADWGPAGAQAA